MVAPGGIRGGTPLRPLPTKSKTDRSENRSGSGVVSGLGGGKKSGKAKRKGRSGKSAGIGVGGAGGIELSEIDAWEDDPDQQRRRQSFLDLLGSDDTVLLNDDLEDVLEPMETIAPEFRPQVTTRMAAARSFTSGSTLSKQERARKAKKKA